ncbi:MAG: ImmA/IrrE family metallo-endopeptidase [bacterium]|nr:ImmA/IrrE family metallo-endopeptidase [bacterium]
MRAELEIIKEKFAGKLIGNSRMQFLVCETLLAFPQEIQNFVTKNCWFVSSFEDAWGFTLRGEEIQKKYLIFLSDELFSESRRQQRYTIAHEIGHVILKHRNAILERQTAGEVAKQEREAGGFAEKYLHDF